MNKFQNVILLQAAIRSVPRATHRGSSAVPLALAVAGHNRVGHCSTDAGISLAHAGVRRSSVSLCAHALQKAGLIQYARGQIIILSRDGLKDSACECYEVIRDHVDQVAPPLS